LTLGLIVAVFARTINTLLTQSTVLEWHEESARNHRITGLENRQKLEADIALAIQSGWGTTSWFYSSSTACRPYSTQLGEMVLAATASLRGDDSGMSLGTTYGEVAIPTEAQEPSVALQVAGQRLAAHKSSASIARRGGKPTRC
jgi:hypothetical protein